MNLVGYTCIMLIVRMQPKIFSPFNRFNHMLPRFKRETQDSFFTNIIS